MIYAPKRKKDTGRFDFTLSDDSYKPPKVEPFGFCKEFWERGNRDGHHATPQEAVECFLSYVLERKLDYQGVLLYFQKCMACGQITMNCVTRESQLFMVLCRDHAKPEVIRNLLRKAGAFQVVAEYAEDKGDPGTTKEMDMEGFVDEVIRNRNSEGK